MHKKKAGKLQTGSTIPKQYWLAVNGKPKKEIENQIHVGPTLSICFTVDSNWRVTVHDIGVGSGAAGAALAAPIFCLVAVLGPRFFSIRQLFVL